jgi:hypothetical protein
MGTAYGNQKNFSTLNPVDLPTVITDTVINITQTSAQSGGNVTSDGGAPVTARGICWSTSPNPTTANSYTANGSGTGSFTSNLTGLTPNTHYYLRAYAINNAGTAYGGQRDFTTTSTGWICGDPITINHSAGNVAPVTKTVTYGTVTNIPGETSKCWITRNLGADRQATSVSEAAEAPAGWYWQFNRKQGFKHDGTTRTPNTTWISSISENSEWQTANDPCTIELGSGWRIPTYTEWSNLDNAGSWNNWNGPWNSSLKLHASGILDPTDGSLEYRGSQGFFWSRSQFDNSNGRGLAFHSFLCSMYNVLKADGRALRCLRD